MAEQRKDYITLAGVISCFAVVTMHTNNVFWMFSTERYWKTTSIIESLLYFAVPVLFMSSGATLLDFYEKYDIKTYFRKRVSKTVIPYLFWSLFANVFEAVRLGKPLGSITLMPVLNGLLTGRTINVYWFFIPLFCVYLSIPLLAAVRKEKRNETFLIAVISWLILNDVIPFVIKVFHLGISSSFSIGIGTGYLACVMTGYLISANDLNPRLRHIIYTVGLCAFIVHAYGTYTLSMNAGKIDELFKGTSNLIGFLYAVSVFVLIKYEISKIIKYPVILKNR